MKKLFALLLAAVMLLGIFGCAAKPSGDAGTIAGSWTYEQDGTDVYWEFAKDGKLYIWVNLSGLNVYISEDSEWSVSGDKLKITSDGETAESRFSLQGDKLTIQEAEETLVLTRCDVTHPIEEEEPDVPETEKPPVTDAPETEPAEEPRADAPAAEEPGVPAPEIDEPASLIPEEMLGTWRYAMDVEGEPMYIYMQFLGNGDVHMWAEMGGLRIPYDEEGMCARYEDGILYLDTGSGEEPTEFSVENGVLTLTDSVDTIVLEETPYKEPPTVIEYPDETEPPEPETEPETEPEVPATEPADRNCYDWYGLVDVSDKINIEMYAALGIVADCTLELPLCLLCYDDGTAEMTVYDTELFIANFRAFMSKMAEACVPLMLEELEASDISLEDFEEMYGMGLQEYMEQLFEEEFDYEELEEGLTGSSDEYIYKEERGQLWLGQDGEYFGYFTFESSDYRTATITGYFSSDPDYDDSIGMFATFPVEFSRTKP